MSEERSGESSACDTGVPDCAGKEKPDIAGVRPVLLLADDTIFGELVSSEKARSTSPYSALEAWFNGRGGLTSSEGECTGDGGLKAFGVSEYVLGVTALPEPSDDGGLCTMRTAGRGED